MEQKNLLACVRDQGKWLRRWGRLPGSSVGLTPWVFDAHSFVFGVDVGGSMQVMNSIIILWSIIISVIT